MTDPLLEALADKDPAAVGYLLGWRTVNKLPPAVVTGLFNLGADIASGNGRSMDQLRRNLTRVVGPDNVTRQLVKDSVRSYMRYWAEAFRLPSLAGDERLLKQVDQSATGACHVAESHRQGRGVVVTMPHTGNWDLAGLWFARRFGSFVTVAERLKPEVLYREFVSFRSSLGFSVLPASGGVRPFPVLTRTLLDGGIVCLLGERDLKRSGCRVDFFGEPAHFPVGPAKLAAATGAALHVGHSWFESGGWGLSISGNLNPGGGPAGEPTAPETVQSLTQDIAHRFAANIAAHPTDWHMLQPVFDSDLEALSARRARAAGRTR
ncbi:phosphatidylinositol mannoside acyltransferase [Corynebacterium mendelii]|uniref:Phosphatidylinositol mannoside acyltransferase n=1 Tax=Corynebacterium mendelii TaxID=2765362 RepID=A0A939E014_9CORY|nr:phosphatidylinositol mannoside acyltransferase [Corynebacterium mendelii]